MWPLIQISPLSLTWHCSFNSSEPLGKLLVGTKHHIGQLNLSWSNKGPWPSQVPSLVEIGQVVLEKNIFKTCQCIFTILSLSLLEKRAGPFIWINLNPLYPRMLCPKFVWNCPIGSWEEDENVLSLWQWRRQRTTAKFWSEKLGELLIISKFFLMIFDDILYSPCYQVILPINMIIILLVYEVQGVYWNHSLCPSVCSSVCRFLSSL